MTIGVRVALEGDAAIAKQIEEAAFAPLRRIYRPSAAQIAHVATLPLERLVAFDGAHLVGTVRWRIDGDRLRVIGLAVAPEHQRRGVASALITVLVALAAVRGCRAIGLYTIEETGNVPVFERLGFTIVREQRDVDSIAVSGVALHETYMERSLADM